MAEHTPENDAPDVDRWSRHLWHTSQHNAMPIFLAGRLQAQANTIREAAGLEPFGWGDLFPDAEFGECSVHSDGCAGQEAHARAIPPAVWVPGDPLWPNEQPTDDPGPTDGAAYVIPSGEGQS